MPARHPIDRYRPSRAADGEGGFAETFGDALAVMGFIRVHANKITALLDAHEDVLVDDYLVVSEDAGPEAIYRVIAAHRIMSTRQRVCELERVARPIFPNARFLVTAGGNNIVFGGHLLVV